MPPPERETLTRAADELQVPLSSHQIDQLLGYRDLLLRWARVINLTAIRDPQAMLSLHLLDCLAAVEPLRRVPGSILDVGSGAGLPGVILGIAMPDRAVTCVDAVAKKVAFVRQAAAELGVHSVNAVHARAENLERRSDVVISRAFASLSDFVRVTDRCRAPGGVWVAMKGQVPESEMQSLPDRVRVFHVEQLRVPALDAKRCLVWLRPADAQN